MEPFSRHKVVITAALTGALTTRKQCEYIPYTPVEIADEAKRCADAGAAVVHIHAREDDGTPSFKVEKYRQIMDEIRKRTDIIINFSTGAVGIPMEQRVGHIAKLRPEIGALNMGSMNYAIYSEKKKEFYFDFVFSNPFKDIIYLLERMNEGGVKPELEVFDNGHIGNTRPLLDMGVLHTPLDFSLVMGVLGGIPSTTKALLFQSETLPPSSSRTSASCEPSWNARGPHSPASRSWRQSAGIASATAGNACRGRQPPGEIGVACYTYADSS